MRTAQQAGEVARRFLLMAEPNGGSGVDAVLSAGGVIGFALKAGAQTVTVAVHDASRLPPRPRPTDATKPGGFGWHLGQELSVDARVQIHSAGKTVTRDRAVSHGRQGAGLKSRDGC
ncbi:ATP-binding protein [Streptomyces galilaeus]|uniref:hypothetical protein n=1 Tax=Streptomyces galilaeus TaxID=33899 RepID=UPI0038F66A04